MAKPCITSVSDFDGDSLTSGYRFDLLQPRGERAAACHIDRCGAVREDLAGSGSHCPQLRFFPDGTGGILSGLCSNPAIYRDVGAAWDAFFSMRRPRIFGSATAGSLAREPRRRSAWTAADQRAAGVVSAPPRGDFGAAAALGNRRRRLRNPLAGDCRDPLPRRCSSACISAMPPSETAPLAAGDAACGPRLVATVHRPRIRLPVAGLCAKVALRTDADTGSGRFRWGPP